MYTLENEELLVMVKRQGAELSKIYDKRKDRDILWDGNPAVWNRHSPVLFPFIGRCHEGKYSYEGKEYCMSAHGFAKDMKFETMQCDKKEVVLVLRDTPETLEKYPFHFELQISYKLVGRTIETLWKVINKNEKDMYFMMGGHPAFRVPKGKSLYDFALVFNQEGENIGKCQKSIHYLAPSEEGYEIPTLQGNLELADGKVHVTPGFFDRVLTYMFDGGQAGSVGLLADGKPYVTVLCDGFPLVGIWTMERTHPFVCIEPWCGICASERDGKELKERVEIQRTAAGETWEKGYSIRVE